MPTTKGLLIALLAFNPASAWAKAYFAPIPKMITEADAIAIVNILPQKPHKDPRQDNDFPISAAVEVKETIAGDLTGVRTISIPQGMPCAAVRVKPGLHLVFLRRQKGIFSNSNWHLSFLPITENGIIWTDAGKLPGPPVPLAEVLKQIKETRRKGESRSNHSVERPAAQ